MFAMEHLQRETQSRFQSGYSIGRALELLLFFMGCMGRMISRNAVDGTVKKPLEHRATVRFRPQWRVHLGVRVVLTHCILRQHKVMGSYFAGNVQAIAAGPANRVQSSRSGQVRDVQMSAAALELGEQA